MNLRKVLTLALYRRPEHTQRLLGELARCYGIEDYQLLISCDYNQEHAAKCDEVIEIARGFQACETQIWINNPRLGIDVNKLFIIPKAFQISDYMIFLEDDLALAQDTLRFFEYAAVRFVNEPRVVAVCGHNRYLEQETHDRVMREQRYSLSMGGGFSPWGWAMWKDRYDRKMGDGSAYAAKYGTEINGKYDDWWYTSMDANLKEGSVYPVLPRVNHTGGEDAEHTPSTAYLMEHEFSPFGAWSQEMPDPTFDMWTFIDTMAGEISDPVPNDWAAYNV